MASIIVNRKGRAEVFHLGSQTTIGRDRDSAIRLVDLEVSRTHCTIESTGAGQFRLTDRSKHGTYVNGAPVDSALLYTGDRIRISSFELLFYLSRPKVPTRGNGVPDPAHPAANADARAVELAFAQFESALRAIERLSGLDGVRRAEEVLSRLSPYAPSSRYAQLMEQRNRLIELIEINRAITSELELEQLLAIIIDDLVEVAGAEQVYLVRFGASASFEVAYCQTRTPGAAMCDPARELSRTILDRVRATGEVIASNDVQADDDLADLPSVSRLGLQSVMCLPLAIDGDVAYALYIENRLRRNAFGIEEHELVAAIADQASIALRSARQRRTIERSHRVLDVLYRATRAITSSLELGPLLDRVVACTRDATGADTVALLLLDSAGNLAFDRGLASDGSRLDAADFACHLPEVRRVLADRRARQHGSSFVVAPLIARVTEHLGVLVVAKPVEGLPTWPGGLDLVEHIAEIAALALSNAHLYQMATTDELTGLCKRGYFDERLQFEIRRSARYELPLAVAMMDLDHFKALNDVHGHAAGDRALAAVGQVLRRNLRATDLAGRLGGEEFAILMPQTSMASAVATAERIRVAIREQAEVPHALSASFGVASHVRDMDAARLLEEADRCLYQAKLAGRDRVHHHPIGLAPGPASQP